jgi:putative flippase GtrA
MSTAASQLIARLDTPERRKFIRYSLVSVVSLVVTVVMQMVCYGLLHFSGGWSAITASTIAAVPSYILNRSWVWGKSGRSHLMREVIPFWAMAFIGLAISTLSSALADHAAHDITEVHALRTIMVTGASVASFAVLWVLKYVIFNKILFVHHEQDLDPALDGRSGLPT